MRSGLGGGVPKTFVSSQNNYVPEIPAQLLDLCHRIADPAKDYCIVAEGNISLTDGSGTLWIKASGEQMATMTAEGLCEVRISDVLRAMDLPMRDSAEVREALNRCSMTKGDSIPSTETYMHASLMEQTGCRVVIHTHPTEMLKLLCHTDADFYANRRIFPDEIVLCGPAACYVPYVAPGLPLAISIRERVTRFREKYGIWPKTIWLQNHGLICIGNSIGEAEAATYMSAKAAAVVVGALQCKAEIHWLTQAEIDSIYDWPDEHYRQRKLD
jgi:rhamnose utilization protein RhaD (predicted bifunctional aldolase and dehydrogenase)